MISKRWTVALSAVIALTLLPQPAVLGWSNGTNGCDSFGTHDWILKKAIAATDPSWVRARVALRATDDPDCKDGIDHASGTWWHVYDRWGEEWGGADEAAAVWFRRLQRRVDNGRRRAASKALGYLAHIVGDVAQPMHTDSSDREDGVHASYEGAVDSRIGAYSFHYDGRDTAKARGRTIAVARDAHRFYGELLREYDRHGYNGRVDTITRRQLKRAANALADLITSLD